MADGRSEEPTIGPGSRCLEEATRTGYGHRRAGEASALATLSRHQQACTRPTVCLCRIADRLSEPEAGEYRSLPATR